MARLCLAEAAKEPQCTHGYAHPDRVLGIVARPSVLLPAAISWPGCRRDYWLLSHRDRGRSCLPLACWQTNHRSKLNVWSFFFELAETLQPLRDLALAFATASFPG